MPHDQMEGKDPTIMLRHFQREVSLWHSLRYDHILPFYGVGMRSESDRTRVYGVSPFLPNRDAVTYRKEHTLSTQESLQIAHDIASALRYLHDRDPMVVHFNVCTKNVLIDDEKRGVLGGFGFSKEISSSGSQPTSNIPSIPSDTTCFRAPEYYNDPNFPLKSSSDVWGWAMSTLELVSGETPFCEIPGGDFQAVTAMARGIRPDHDAYPNVQQLSDPNALWGLLEECWLHDAAKRPSMGEVVMRIRGIKEGQNELGRRDPPVVPAPGPRRRSQGTSVEPVDGQANRGTVQGRAPGQRQMSQDVVDQGRLSHAAQQSNAPWPGEGQ
ncbi:kinase-like protein [Ceratobasidium sp. AG-I]|nr:kinase-like protein [Ceratobasidium sp. AG-I]